MAIEDGFIKSSKTDAVFCRELANEKASVKRLEKELRRKTDALADALLILQKKSTSDLGGGARG